MQIGSIQLLEFRNYRTLSYRPSPKLNVLAGANAQGKTNLLEAVAVLLTGRSFRTLRLNELPRWGAESASLSGEIRRHEGSRTLRRAIERREDGTWHGSGDDCEWARAVAFGWQDLEIINGSPAARRDFLDGFAARLYPSHRAAYVRYRQILARRNHLLQQHLSPDALGPRLAPWDEQLATVGVELIDRRRRAAAALQTEIGRIYPSLAGGHTKVEIQYRSTLGDATGPQAMVAALTRVRRDEMRRGLTLIGPHRDDLGIELDSSDARAFGSRGQQRLVALALRLAEVLPITEATGTPPVLLLDDALSELDATVRENVLREIEPAEQVFLTTPDRSVSGGTRWRVHGGEVTAA
ncbi:MAG: DNA replication and repair protein RecF [Candidatus Rokubacteria bacterium]|nr:DNA replication and repair protein RecF [Candidatus Rokubacteria bacterium]